MRRILCLCHDVTDADIARAVRLGYRHPETVKRYTGALTGPCQGRTCADPVLDAIATELGVPRSDLGPPAARPPAFAVRMGDLATGEPVDRAALQSPSGGRGRTEPPEDHA